MIGRWLGAAILLLAAPAGSAPLDWTRTAVRTAAGGIKVGNPKARVGFVEIANYTCPHCAHFSQAGAATLAQRIRSGALAVEYRPLVNDNIGLAATVVARCAAPGAFLAVNDAFYARQEQWYWQATAYVQANAARLERYADLDQLRLIAEQGGVAAVATAAGLPAARIAACFADRRMLDDTLRAITAAAATTNSTPTFLFGSQKFEGLAWPDVAAKLRAAGLK